MEFSISHILENFFLNFPKIFFSPQSIAIDQKSIWSSDRMTKNLKKMKRLFAI